MLTSCSKQSPQPELTEFTDSDAQAVSEKIGAILRNEERIEYFCGESNGLAIHGFDWEKGWQPDGIRGGFFAFTETTDGIAEIIWGSDFTGVVRTTDDGGVVKRNRSSGGAAYDTWIVHYPTNGITETFGIIQDPEAEFVLFHSTMKPGGPSARLFQARCKKWH